MSATLPANGFTIAAIDLGSNAVRLEIGRLTAGRVIEVLCFEREPARLGQEVFRTGALSEPARESVLAALGRFAILIRRFEPDVVRAVATSATREAANYEAFVREAKARTGIEIDVISGGEEARLLCLGALGGMAPDRESLVIDVGGGSTEIAVARGSDVLRAKSLPLGTVRLTEIFLKDDPPRKKQVKLLQEYVREILKARLEKDLVGRFSVAVACAGTAGATAAMIRGEPPPGAPSASAPPHVTNEEVRALLERLVLLSSAERARLPGCDPSRADVIVAGVAIYEGLIEHLRLDELEVSRRGIRNGLMIDTLRRRGLWDARDPDEALFDAVEALGRRFDFDFAHARQVRRLSLAMFDALRGEIVAEPARVPIEERGGAERRVGSPTEGRRADRGRIEGHDGEAGDDAEREAERARRVLGVAAMLHDLGQFINFSRHHKHSAYLIANAEIPGLTETEKILASTVARYHRRAHPRERHPEFAMHSPEHRVLVRKLAAILRIADGLDRTHDGRVEEIRVRIRKGRVEAAVVSAKDLELELWAVRQKAGLFHEAFGAELSFKAVGPAAGGVPKGKRAPGRGS